MKPVFYWFREHGIRCNYYIDDSLNMNQNFSVCQTNTEIIVRTLKSLGFLINVKKSVLVPSHKIIFFGFLLDSGKFKVFLTMEKMNKIICKAHSLLKVKKVVIRDLASL